MTLTVLRDVTFCLCVHEIMALMGPNGCGKTTLLNVIGGETRPDSGTVELDGNQMLSLQPHDRYRWIARVHQESYKSLATDLSVDELLGIAAKRNRYLSLQRVYGSRAIETIGKFSAEISSFLYEHRALPARLLSGGQRQLLSVALAALGQPKLLLLDEHIASLDDQYREVVDTFLSTLVSQQQSAALVVTHNRSWAKSQANSVREIHSGHLVRV
jgi:putative tryptophan/tyrosine transport system ATP-binding protein